MKRKKEGNLSKTGERMDSVGKAMKAGGTFKEGRKEERLCIQTLTSI